MLHRTRSNTRRGGFARVEKDSPWPLLYLVLAAFCPWTTPLDCAPSHDTGSRCAMARTVTIMFACPGAVLIWPALYAVDLSSWFRCRASQRSPLQIARISAGRTPVSASEECSLISLAGMVLCLLIRIRSLSWRSPPFISSRSQIQANGYSTKTLDNVRARHAPNQLYPR
jgi:hypothetical protein